MHPPIAPQGTKINTRQKKILQKKTSRKIRSGTARSIHIYTVAIRTHSIRRRAPKDVEERCNVYIRAGATTRRGLLPRVSRARARAGPTHVRGPSECVYTYIYKSRRKEGALDTDIYFVRVLIL